MRQRRVWLVAVLGACGSKKDEPAPAQPPEPEPAIVEASRIALREVKDVIDGNLFTMLLPDVPACPPRGSRRPVRCLDRWTEHAAVGWTHEDRGVGQMSISLDLISMVDHDQSTVDLMAKRSGGG